MKIIKRTDGLFVHQLNGKDYLVERFSLNIIDGKCDFDFFLNRIDDQVLNSLEYRRHEISQVIFQDGTNPEETFANVDELLTRLVAVNYSGIKAPEGTIITQTNTLTVTNVSSLIVGADLNAKKTIIYNEGNKNLYVGYGTPATPIAFAFKLKKGEQFTEELFKGNVYGVTDSGSTNVNVTKIG